MLKALKSKPILILLLGLLLVGGSFLAVRQGLFSERPLEFANYTDLSEKNVSKADYDDALKLHSECFEEVRRVKLFKYLTEVKYPNSDKMTEDSIRKWVDRQIEEGRLEKPKSFHETENVTLAKRDGHVIGLYNCRDDTNVTHNSIMIYNVCVGSKFRGKGVGKQVMLHAIQRCQTPGRDLTLTVYKDNEPAIKLYEKIGFKIIEKLKEPDDEFSFFDKYLMIYQAAPIQ